MISPGRSLALICLALFAACQEPTGPSAGASYVPTSQALLSGTPFVGVKRQAMNDIDIQGDDDHFYLAINKNALTKRWFLSSYLKQYFPGAVSYGAARSLGTRIVSFKVQNDKLYVFSSDAIKKTSDTFDPEIVVDAYPLVTGYDPFNQQPGNGNYVLIDPAAGMNRFNMMSDSNGAYGLRFEIELAFVQRFRALPDGVTYELLFTGYTDTNGADPNSWQLGEDNALRGSGTLGMALREYKESQGFTASEYDERYFGSDLQLVANKGETKTPAAKWMVKPGMQPIIWKISPQFQELAALPEYQGFDLVQAAKNGIERWNEAFGFEVLRAEVAQPDESYADDDVNYLILDKDPSYGAAFANWRTNPNTGEIRGASVYFNAGWFGYAGDAAKNVTARPIGTSTPKLPPSLTWSGMREDRLCTYTMADRLNARLGKRPIAAGGATSLMTEKEKFEEYVTHVILHEIGHTLGLRHNFRGSLVPPSSSVMDYLTDEDTIPSGHPGAYDVEAIKYLYGLQATKPAQPFCNDGDVSEASDCNRFDTGATPLDAYVKDYDKFTDSLFDPTSKRYTWPTFWKLYYFMWNLTDLMKFVREGNAATAGPALTAALKQVGVNATKHTAAADKDLLNALHQALLKNLYLDPSSSWGQIQWALPTSNSAVVTQIMAELDATLQNADKLRTYQTRRVAVDTLKAMQTTEALQLLRDTNLKLQIEATTLSGATLLEHQDLMSRIDAAMHPYFIQ